MLSAVVLLGLVLRVLGIAENPPGFYFDESAFAANAALIAEAGVDQYGESWPIFFRALDDYKDPLLIYPMALSIKLMGLTEASARLPAALFGVLGLLVAYALCREVSGSSQAGVWASLFLAVTPWHIHFSRWVEQPIILSVAHSAAVLLMIRLTRRPSVGNGAFAGLALASGLYAYSTAKLLVAVSLLVFVVFAWRRRLLRSPGFAAFLAGFAAAALPFAVFYLGSAGTMNLRYEHLRIPWQEMPRAFLSSLGPDFLFGRGDPNLRHATRAAMLPWYLAPLALAGAAVVVSRRSLAGLALLGVLAFTPTLGALTRQYPHAGRAITLLPAIQVLAAVGAVALLARVPPRRQGGARVLLLAVVAVSLFGFWEHYWTRYAVRSRESWRHGLIPALDFAARHGRSGESIYAPTAHYSDWMFVTRTRAAQVIAHRESLAAGRDSYDPHDVRGKYAFFQPRAYLGRAAGAAARREQLQRGVWVLPLDSQCPLLEGLLYRNAGYCVARVP